MKLCVLLVAAAAAITHRQDAEAFSSPRITDATSSRSRLLESLISIEQQQTHHSSPALSNGVANNNKKTTKTLGLITFDLDDSLYPIAPVLRDADVAFARAMASYGYNLSPNSIVESGQRIRAEAGTLGSAITHKDMRLLAIRREMEKKMFERKVGECAKDWATEVSSVTGPVRRSAAKWAQAAVSQSVVESIYRAWEGERHHSAERHLYPEALASLQRIREEHPDAVIGAVTDGRANPLLMVFTLAPFFDFCISWEDDAAGRTEFFKELCNVDGNADLQWIYRAAYEKYRDIAETKKEMKTSSRIVSSNDISGGTDDDPIWIHVGDDLAYDVGGSASCGARTILLDLDDEYGQTAKARFDPDAKMPSWSTAPIEEIVNRRAMNDAAESMVNKRVSRLSMLPDVIDEILKKY
jgi:putative hydrolase of the HAD superfamily